MWLLLKLLLQIKHVLVKKAHLVIGGTKTRINKEGFNAKTDSKCFLKN